MIRYLPAYAESLNSRTPALRLTALSQWHVHQGFADPASTPTVRKILRRHCADKRQAEEEGQGAADRGSGAHHGTLGQSWDARLNTCPKRLG